MLDEDLAHYIVAPANLMGVRINRADRVTRCKGVLKNISILSGGMRGQDGVGVEQSLQHAYSC